MVKLRFHPVRRFEKRVCYTIKSDMVEDGLTERASEGNLGG
jgi:hypothetical protein